MARPIIWSLLAAALLSASLPANAETEAQMLDRASKSFSPYKFDTPIGKLRGKFDRETYEACPTSEECSFVDKNGVEHHFWSDGASLLVLKTIDVRKSEGRKIGAMNIGKARSKDAVLTRVDRFFNGRQIDCDEHANEYDAWIVCEVNLGEGWTKLFFDKRLQLVYVRLDAYQYV